MKRLTRARRCGSSILIAAAGLLACISAAAQQPDVLYEFAPAADWVDLVPASYDAPPAGAAGSGRILLLDRQLDITAEGDEYYQHFAVELVNAADVDEYSQINIGVDPTYQRLALHWMRVIRNGEVIDQQPVARITALPQETELASRIYNGGYNVNVLLADVRIGDIVDFAYTVRSEEQLFPGHFATRLDTAWGMRVVRQRIRVRAPASRGLRFRMTDGTSVPEPVVRGDRRELVMEWANAAPVAVEPSIPIWYYPWPSLEISDLESWQHAAELVAPLFAPRPGASTRVGAIVDQIRAGGGSLHDQALRALQYVQEQIRYTSIAIGRGSHTPADPDLVLERRFGDCKDKSLLLATILNGLGIEARPALVHSWRGRTLADALPTPYAFDHVIVRAEIEGSTYWLDATAATRYSPLAADDPADYELALVTGGAGRLETIPKPAPHTRGRAVDMVFDLRDGLDAPATLEIRTRYRGTLADAMRPVLARSTPEQREADFASYVARYYPGARTLAPMEIDDDKARNELEIRESYRLDGPFDRDESGFLSFYLHADELYSYADASASGARRMPLGIEYPIEIRQRLVVHLPDEWRVEPATVLVENPAFRYRSEVRYAARTLDLTYDYRALDDHVPLAALADYEADRSRFYDDLGYVLTYDDGSLGGRLAIAPLPLAGLLLALGLGVWGARRLYRYDPEPQPGEPGDPVGIRGWLLLPALGAIVSPALFGFVVFSWLPFVDADVWYNLPNVVNETHRAWAHAALLVLVSTGVLVFIASVVVAVLFFQKRTSAPAAYIALQWIGAGFVGAMLWWGISTGLDTESTGASAIADLARDLITTVIWTLYMLSSRRVRATFVRRLPQRRAEAASGMLPA